MSEQTHDLLRKIVSETKGPKGWRFTITDDGEGHAGDPHSRHRQLRSRVPLNIGHCHPVPHASYNEASWRRWIFDQCIRAFNHELGEQLRFGPSEVRPFEPCHGPGKDPYTVHEYRPAVDALTRQDGSLREPS